MQAGRTFGLAVAGGGTGGHIFPGLAVAREFRRREPGARVLYLGAAGRLEERVVPREGSWVRFHGLRMRGIAGTGALGALRAPDLFGTYLAFGLTFCLFLQAVINIMVVAGLMPTKGLTLPFPSYGGTSLLASLVAVGILLNISQHGVSAKAEAG